MALTLLLSCILVLVPAEETSAREIPQYQDASDGLPTTSLWVARPEFFDLDNNGMGDLTILGPRKGPGSHSLHMFSWDGTSWTDTSAQEGTDNVPHWSYGGHEFGDLDNDGDWDVGAGSHGAERVDAYMRSFGTIWLQSSNGLGNSEDGWNVDVGDYNNDGNLDLLVGGFWGHDLRAYAGDGNGNWIDQSDGFESAAASHAEGYFCDVNNDGNLDAVANLRGGSWCYLGDGNGGWTNSSEGLPGGFGVAPAFGDFNNDGNIDIAFCTMGETYAFEGDGTGHWTERSDGLPDDRYVSMRMADLNNDEYDDLVCMYNSDPGVVDLYLADGTGKWTKIADVDMEGNAQGRRINAGDFDHNGYRDIVGGFGTEEEFGSIRVWKETSIPTELGAFLDYPNGGEYIKPGSIRFIKWRSALPSGTGPRTVKLELSTEGNNGPWNLIEEGLPDSGIYQWTVPDELSGDCFMKITVAEDGGDPAWDISDHAFGIDQIPNTNLDPTIEVLKPSQEQEPADQSYTIEWSAEDEDEDQITITLYYDEDTDPDNSMTFIEGDLENTGNYDWGSSEVEDGEYYIYAVAEDDRGGLASDYSSGTVHIDHGSQNHDPIIEVLEPGGMGEEADESFIIQWDADDEDSDTVTIDLYYDEDTVPGNGKILITSGLENTGEFNWDCSEVDEEEYYIYAIADDNNGGIADDHSEGTILIRHEGNAPPEIEVLEPDDEDTADKDFTITWSADDDDGDTLEIDLYYDKDLNPNNGKTKIESELSNTGSYVWDCSEVEEGEYKIYAQANDKNGHRVGDYSTGTVTISHPITENHPPDITVSVEETDDYTFTINWDAVDEDGDTLTIDLYYDTDTDPDNGKTQIIEKLDDTGSYDWDISFMDNGDYHMYGVAKDMNGGEGMGYSEKFTIALPDHLPDCAVISLDILQVVLVDEGIVKLELGSTVLIRARVQNLGNAIGSGKVEFLVDEVVQASHILELQPGEEETFLFSWTGVEGNHSIIVRVKVPEDPESGNDELVKAVSVTGSPTKVEGEDDEFPVAWVGLIAFALVLVAGTITIFRRNSSGGFDEIEVEGGICSQCGSLTTYYADMDDYYCYQCKEYVGEGEQGDDG